MLRIPHRKMPAKDYILYTAVIFGGILLDMLAKRLAVKFLAPIDTFPIIRNVLHLTYVENRGAAFGMLSNHRWVFLSVSTAAILFFTVLLYLGNIGKRLTAVSLAMIISGGIGNMIDRIALGYVVDFVDFRLIHFAVFNTADTFVCVGAGLLFLSLLLDILREQSGKGSGEERRP